MASDPDESVEHASRTAVEGFGDWSEDDAFDAGDADLPATRGGPDGTFLLDLADTLRAAGLTVKEHDGWRQRCRSSGGYAGGPIGVIIHHTASPPSWDGQKDVDFIVSKPEAAPLANLYLDRRGAWWVIAAGATNTNGKGGPWGPIAEQRANATVIGIEAGNTGLGEPWPDAMQDSYVAGVAALADRYGIDSNNVLSHNEWRSSKIDPAGPSRFGSINQYHTWDMNLFRKAVNDARAEAGKVHVVATSRQAPATDTYVVQPGDAWWSIAAKTMGNPGSTWESLAAANGGPDRVLLTGQVLTIPGAAAKVQGLTSPAAAAPAFPGEAKRGMTGPIVLAWQLALIDHTIIADNDDNRDEAYGAGMEKAVLKLQQQWGWPKPTGVADSATWKQLHS